MDSYSCPKCKDRGGTFDENGTYHQCECVAIKRAKTFMERSGLNPEQAAMKFNTYTPHDSVTTRAKENAKNYVTNFMQLDQKANWLALLGNNGAGKTHLVAAIATNLINQKFRPVEVMYMPYLETMQYLRQNNFNESAYATRMERYSTAELLVVDDLFKDKVRNGKKVFDLSAQDTTHIMPILNYRYMNCLPTVISSEATPVILSELDEAMAWRILERCRDNLVVFKGDKYNYRKRTYRG